MLLILIRYYFWFDLTFWFTTVLVSVQHVQAPGHLCMIKLNAQKNV